MRLHELEYVYEAFSKVKWSFFQMGVIESKGKSLSQHSYGHCVIYLAIISSRLLPSSICYGKLFQIQKYKNVLGVYNIFHFSFSHFQVRRLICKKQDWNDDNTTHIVPCFWSAPYDTLRNKEWEQKLKKIKDWRSLSQVDISNMHLGMEFYANNCTIIHTSYTHTPVFDTFVVERCVYEENQIAGWAPTTQIIGNDNVNCFRSEDIYKLNQYFDIFTSINHKNLIPRIQIIWFRPAYGLMSIRKG